MDPADRLAALRDAALFEIDKIDDDHLLGKPVAALAEQIVQPHYLEAPRLDRVVITPPKAVRMGGPGGPGQEHELVVRPATRVELWLLVGGLVTLRTLDQDGDLDLGEARIDAENQCLAIPYLAERPVAHVANEYFQAALHDVEERMERLATLVHDYNESLLPAVTAALEDARARAKERKRFASGLELPRLHAAAGVE